MSKDVQGVVFDSGVALSVLEILFDGACHEDFATLRWLEAPIADLWVDHIYGPVELVVVD